MNFTGISSFCEKTSRRPPWPFPESRDTRSCNHNKDQRIYLKPWESILWWRQFHPTFHHPYVHTRWICTPDSQHRQHRSSAYEDYVSEIINGSVSLWDPVKKEKNMMYMSGNKNSAVKIRDKIVDKGNKRFVWAVDSPCAFKQRHWSGAYSLYLWVYTYPPIFV